VENSSREAGSPKGVGYLQRSGGGRGKGRGLDEEGEVLERLRWCDGGEARYENRGTRECLTEAPLDPDHGLFIVDHGSPKLRLMMTILVCPLRHFVRQYKLSKMGRGDGRRGMTDERCGNKPAHYWLLMDYVCAVRSCTAEPCLSHGI
jgi:hypothetical protein